jgi:hypothetical protein
VDSIADEHYAVDYPRMVSFRRMCILSTPRGVLRTTKSSYTPSLLRGDCNSVREVLSKSRINAKMHESQGFLMLLLLPLLMDSYKMMMYLHAQYENELLFNRL